MSTKGIHVFVADGLQLAIKKSTSFQEVSTKVPPHVLVSDDHIYYGEVPSVSVSKSTQLPPCNELPSLHEVPSTGVRTCFDATPKPISFPGLATPSFNARDSDITSLFTTIAYYTNAR